MRLASKQNQLSKNAQNAFLVQMPEKLLSHVRLCTLLSQFFGYLTINNIYRVFMLFFCTPRSKVTS